MSDWFEKFVEKVKSIDSKLDSYQKDSVIQSLPSVAYVNRAKKLIEKGQYKDALDLLIKAESLPQEDALVFKYQGIIYDKLFRFDDSVKAYKKSANLNPADKIIWKNLGFALLNTGLYDESEESFENADKITPANSEVLMGWGMALMKQDKVAEAREKFVLSSKINRYNSNAIFLAAVMEIKLKMYEEAENKLQFLANVSPNEANSYEYAKLKYIQNDYDSAIFYANKALSFNKNMLPVYLLLGKIYRIKSEEENSLSNYKVAEELSLIIPNLYIEWAISLIKFEKYTEAFEKLDKAKELGADVDEVAFYQLFIDVVNGNKNVDVESFSNISVDDDRYPLAQRALGYISCLNEKYMEGIHYFKAALSKQAADTINYYYIAKAYMHLGDDSNVKEYFETYLKYTPDSFNGYVDYAKYLIAVEKYADANRKLRKAIKLDDKNISVLNMLFYVNYILVNQNVCEYNIKETLEFEKRIKEIDENAFKYPDESARLAEMLNEIQKKELN